MSDVWRIKSLDEVCDFRNGLWTGKKPPFKNVGVIRNTNFTKDGKLDDSDIVYLDVEQAQFEKRKLQFGDLILEKSGGGPKQPVGRVIIFDKRSGDFSFSNFTSSIRVKDSEELDFTYLQRYLYFSYISGVTDQMQSHSTGIRNLKFEEYKQIKIPIPPLQEQQRIVSILNEVFAAIAKAKANTERNLQNIKELFNSSLYNVFANPGIDWEEKALGEVANTWGRIGWKGLTAKEYTTQGPLFLSVHSLNYGDYVDYRDAFHISQTRYDESPEIMLQPDDILICKDGAGIGKLGIVAQLPGPSTINSSLLLIRSKGGIRVKYLYYSLLSPFFQNIVKSKLMGATTPHLYQRDIVTFSIYLPPLIEQEQIVQKLERLSIQAKKLESNYQQKLNDLDELKKSILQKAFSGELKTLENEMA